MTIKKRWKLYLQKQQKCHKMQIMLYKICKYNIKIYNKGVLKNGKSKTKDSENAGVFYKA